MSPVARASLLLLVASGLFLRSAHGDYKPPPNIVVFMADDLGWNDVGFHGSSEIPTPNIDALAYNGLILNRHYVLPSCTPTRAAFFTGKYPMRMGMQGEGIMGGEPRGLPLSVGGLPLKLLPQHLRDLGYTSKLVGKWHLGFLTPEHTPTYRGFDHFLGFYNSHISYYDYKFSQGHNMTGFDMHRDDTPAHDIQKVYATDLFTDEAVKIINEHDLDISLYLQISHLGVHAPLEEPPEWLRYGQNGDQFKHIKEKSRKKYAKMVASLDDSLGRVVTALGNSGMLQNTIILFLTDNGASTIGKFRNSGSNYPLRGTKYTLYEGGVRGVAAIWAPHLHLSANVSTDLFHVTDWLPTLYAAAGGDVRELGDIDGVNQWPYLSKGAPPQRKFILLNMDEVSKTESAIFQRHKLVRGSYKRGYYDGYLGESGRYENVPEYNYTVVHRSTVASAISAHISGPMTQPSRMAHLRQHATVTCHDEDNRLRKRCNETECLFDIFTDPCETKNVISHFGRAFRELDLFLERHSNQVMKQPRVGIDFVADPRRRNDTWEPWLKLGQEPTSSAMTAFSTLALYAHIGILLLLVAFGSIV